MATAFSRNIGSGTDSDAFSDKENLRLVAQKEYQEIQMSGDPLKMQQMADLQKQTRNLLGWMDGHMAKIAS